MRYNTSNYLKIYNTFYRKAVVGLNVNVFGAPTMLHKSVATLV